jgi:hypothetical protein
MLRGPLEEQLAVGGALWVPDLTTADTAFVLPVTAVCVTYASLEISFGRRLPPGFARVSA